MTKIKKNLWLYLTALFCLCLLVAYPSISDDVVSSSVKSIGLAYPSFDGSAVSDVATITISARDEWIDLQNNSTNRIWYSFNGLIGSITNVVGTTTNVLGEAGAYIEASGRRFFDNPAAGTLTLISENVVSNEVFFTIGR